MKNLKHGQKITDTRLRRNKIQEKKIKKMWRNCYKIIKIKLYKIYKHRRTSRQFDHRFESNIKNKQEKLMEQFERKLQENLEMNQENCNRKMERNINEVLEPVEIKEN